MPPTTAGNPAKPNKNPMSHPNTAPHLAATAEAVTLHSALDGARAARGVLYTTLGLALLAHLVRGGGAPPPPPPIEGSGPTAVAITQLPSEPDNSSQSDDVPPEPLGSTTQPQPTPGPDDVRVAAAQTMPLRATRAADERAQPPASESPDLTPPATEPSPTDARPEPDQPAASVAVQAATAADSDDEATTAHIVLGPAAPDGASDTTRSIRLRFADDQSRARSLGDVVCESADGLLQRTSGGVCVVSAARFSGYVVDAYELERCGQYDALTCGRALVDPVASQVRAAARDLADGAVRSGTVRLVNNNPTIVWDTTGSQP